VYELAGAGVTRWESRVRDVFGVGGVTRGSRFYHKYRNTR
jgi:hypothetical protein